MIQDKYGRSFKTLRVSLLNTCNLACTYCTCGQDEIKQNYQKPKSNTLTAKELLRLIENLHKYLNLKAIRFTGGEPLLFKDLEFIVKGVKSLGIDDLRLTTNGILLEQQAAVLKAAGINSINVSLDALEEEIFYKMSRRKNVDRVLKGIEAAKALQFDLKINTVITKGFNDNQLMPLLNFASERNIRIRFLEIMKMGHLHESTENYFFSQDDMLELISKHYKFKPLTRSASATANYWQIENGAVFGIIANESQPFCGDCNRLRLDSEGNIYGCLSNNNPISLKNVSDKRIIDFKLIEAIEQKQSLKFTGSALSMMQIGG